MEKGGCKRPKSPRRNVNVQECPPFFSVLSVRFFSPALPMHSGTPKASRPPIKHCIGDTLLASECTDTPITSLASEPSLSIRLLSREVSTAARTCPVLHSARLSPNSGSRKGLARLTKRRSSVVIFANMTRFPETQPPYPTFSLWALGLSDSRLDTIVPANNGPNELQWRMVAGPPGLVHTLVMSYRDAPRYDSRSPVCDASLRFAL
jgi:hypothetical protein